MDWPFFLFHCVSTSWLDWIKFRRHFVLSDCTFNCHLNSIQFILKIKAIHCKKKQSHFDTALRNYNSTRDSKYWRIFESNWLDIESQFELTLNIESLWFKYSPITRNLGQILVLPVTQLFRSKWLHFFLSV